MINRLNAMNILRNILSAGMIATALSAFAWGQKGHDVTAAIAERHLTPATKAAVDSLLGNRSMVYYANWLDNASHTPEYAYSKTWHYKNIDAGDSYEDAPENKDGDVVTAIAKQVAVLKNPKTSYDEKNIALRMIVHLVGDAHQPMHVGHATDRGGNGWKVRYFTTPANLHGIWDSNLVESAHKWSFTEWVDQIDRLSASEANAVIAGDPDAWTKQTWTICTQVYNSTPQDTSVSYDYISDWTPVIEQQLVRGGHRLAHVLNSVFDTDYRKK